MIFRVNNIDVERQFSTGFKTIGWEIRPHIGPSIDLLFSLPLFTIGVKNIETDVKMPITHERWFAGKRLYDFIDHVNMRIGEGEINKFDLLNESGKLMFDDKTKNNLVSYILYTYSEDNETD